ncbi:MAG: 30S ribosomal protein S5 [Verrucomicrobiota bacterium]
MAEEKKVEAKSQETTAAQKEPTVTIPEGVDAGGVKEAVSHVEKSSNRPARGANGRGRGGQQGGRGQQRRGGRQQSSNSDDEKEYIEKIVFINRCAKVVKGGRRFSFSALMVSGDGSGNVGVGFGKANEVSEAIRKAGQSAKREMQGVHLTKTSIPHEVYGEFGGARVLLRPASEGTGLIAGGGVRAVVEAAGVQNVLGKSLGSSNAANVVKATMEALKQLRTKEQIYQARGKALAAKN